MIDYRVIATGSKGNAVVINGIILIDCGVPFRALKDVCNGLQLVLLTHIHGDHFNRSTIRRLAQERPTLRWGCCEWLACELRELVEPCKIDVFDDGGFYWYSGITVKPVILPHDVHNCGYCIDFNGHGKMFYATDTNSMDGIEAHNYDLYLIEANYTESEITERIRRKQEAGEYCYEWDVLKNHLSREKALDWLYRNMDSQSQYVLLHEHET